MNNGEKYVRATTIQQNYDVSFTTLRRWAEGGKIRFKRTSDKGKRLYCLEDVKKYYNGGESEKEEKSKVCYARVSSQHQKEDLGRQVEQLRSEYPKHEIIKDIGSGLNWKRKGFTSLLERVMSGNVEEIVVSYKDRMCRFGFEFIEQICKKFNTKLLVLNKNEDEVDTTKELSEDLLSVVTYFTAKNNGLRAGKNRRKRKEREEASKKETEEGDSKRRKTTQSKKDKNISKSKGKGNLKKVVRELSPKL